MNTITKKVRVAGVLYLLLAITGFPGLILIPRALIVPADAAATADRIRTSEALFRLGITSELVSGVLFIFVALALYRLFSGVDRDLASLMVILVLVSVPIGLVAVASEMGVPALLSGADIFSALGTPQRQALAMVLLRLHGQGVAVAAVFWGLWLFPLGVLAIRSGFVPRVVGALVIVAGTGYVTASFASLLLPAYATLVASVAMVAEAGEFAMILWLLWAAIRPTSLARAEIVEASST